MAQGTTRIEIPDLSVARQRIPDGTPVIMVNLLRYREQADYGGRTDIVPCSGREAYRRYWEPAVAIVRRLGGQMFSFGPIAIPLYAPADEQWDDVLLVQYPDFAGIEALLADPAYQAVAFHRAAALADTRVYATLPTGGIA